MAAARQRGHRDLGLLMAGLGILLGLLHVGIAAFPPDRSLPAFLAVCAVAVVLIVVIVLAWLRARSATPARGGRRYLATLASSVVLYLGGLTVFLLGSEPLWLAVIIGAVIAAPLVIAGVREVKR